MASDGCDSTHPTFVSSLVVNFGRKPEKTSNSFRLSTRKGDEVVKLNEREMPANFHIALNDQTRKTSLRTSASSSSEAMKLSSTIEPFTKCALGSSTSSSIKEEQFRSQSTFSSSAKCDKIIPSETETFQGKFLSSVSEHAATSTLETHMSVADSSEVVSSDLDMNSPERDIQFCGDESVGVTWNRRAIGQNVGFKQSVGCVEKSTVISADSLQQGNGMLQSYGHYEEKTSMSTMEERFATSFTCKESSAEDFSLHENSALTPGNATLFQESKGKLYDYSKYKRLGTESSTTTVSNEQKSTHIIDALNCSPPADIQNIHMEYDVKMDNPDQPCVISIFKGHVRLKSKAFESSKSLEGKTSSASAGGISSAEDKHTSQFSADDVTSVDGHVRVKQSLFETFPVDALYEHGMTHSSQIITRGRKKSDMEEIMNEFQTKPLSDINHRDSPDSAVSNGQDDAFAKVDISAKINSFKTFEQRRSGNKVLHESQIVDEDVPHHNELVSLNTNRFERKDFCHEQAFHTSQTVTKEEARTLDNFKDVKGEFEQKPLDYIGIDDRPALHQSQLQPKVEHGRQEEEKDDFVLCEPHHSQQTSYHEGQLTGLSQVKEKRRQYYDHCNSPISCISRELLNDRKILNSPDLSGVVRSTTTMYLDDVCSAPDKDNLHSSQRVDTCCSSGLSEETQQCHGQHTPEPLELHVSQVIDPAEYRCISSEVRAKKKVFTSRSGSLHKEGENTILVQDREMLMSQVGPKKQAFECQQFSNAAELHSSQIVGHDFHLISASEASDHESVQEKPVLHGSQKVNFGVVRPRLPTPSTVVAVDEGQSDLPAGHSDTIANAVPGQLAPVSPGVDEKDLQLLLNYTPVVQKEMPSMVTVMTKGVPADLIESGHPLLVEYVTDSRSGKKISVGSIETRKHSQCSRLTDPDESSRCSSYDFVDGTMGHENGPPPDFVQLDATNRKHTGKPACSISASAPVHPGPPVAHSPESSPPLPPTPMSADYTEISPDLMKMLPPPPHFVDVIASQPSDFVLCEPGSTLCDPGRCLNMVPAPEEEMMFWTLDQENALKERFSKHRSRQKTSSAESSSFLRIADENSSRKISTVTVESYPESDDY